MSKQILKSLFASALFIIFPLVCQAAATDADKPLYLEHHRNGSIKTEATSKIVSTGPSTGYHVIRKKHYAEGSGPNAKGDFVKETSETQLLNWGGDGQKFKQESVENHPNGSIKRVVQTSDGGNTELEYLEGKEPGERGKISKTSFKGSDGKDVTVEENYRDDGSHKSTITKRAGKLEHETHFDDDGETAVKNTNYEPDGSRLEVLHGKPSKLDGYKYNINNSYDKDGKLINSIDTGYFTR